MTPRLPAVSLFTNCGAGDLGYRNAGFRFQVIAELDEERLNVAALNHPGATSVAGDLRTTWPEVVAAYRVKLGDKPPALLAACPPCQGMSSARSGRGLERDPEAGSRDTRNLLVDIVAKVAGELAPRAVVVENVMAFLTRQVHHPDNGAPVSAACLLINRLLVDYAPFAIRADLADFGVPQTRKRSFLTLIRRTEPALPRLLAAAKVPFPAVTHGPDSTSDHVTIRDALEALGADRLDSSSIAIAGAGMHTVPVLDADRYLMIACIPANSGASAWMNEICCRCGSVDAALDAASCPVCAGPLARPVVFDTETQAWRLVNGFRNSSYRRMRPDRPAATITTASGRLGSDNTLHPSENRVLSMLECQHLQSIPPTFDWGDHLERIGHTSLREMIGEAVPPQFTEQHGRIIASLLEGRMPRAAMGSDDRRTASATAILRAQGWETEQTRRTQRT